MLMQNHFKSWMEFVHCVIESHQILRTMAVMFVFRSQKFCPFMFFPCVCTYACVWIPISVVLRV